MTEDDDLDRRIAGLLRLQRVAWRMLAERATTPEEGREARAQLRKSSNHLHALFEMRSQRELSLRGGARTPQSNPLATQAA